MIRAHALFLLLVLSLLSGACNVERSSSFNPLGPTSTGSPSSQGNSAPPIHLAGTWLSMSTSPVPGATSSGCTGFEWTVTSQTATTLAVDFSAACFGIATVTGQGTGTLTSPTTVAISIKGVAALPQFPACDVAVSGDGVVVHEDALKVTFTGTSCLGPFSGTETLRRQPRVPPSSAPPPDTGHSAPPPPPPPPPPPSGSGTPNLYHIVQQVAAQYPHLLQINTWESCGEFTQRVLAEFGRQGHGGWGHVGKTPHEGGFWPVGSSQKVSHDVIWHQPSNQQVDILSYAAANSHHDPVQVPRGPANPEWGVIPREYYRAENFWVPPIPPP